MSLPVVFIHGLFGSAKDWDLVLMGLRHLDARTLNLPGHSEHPEKWSGYTIDDFSAWLEQQTPKPVHFVGYSMGGRVLLNLYERRPDLFLSLTLVSASPGIEDQRQRRDRLGVDGQWCDFMRRAEPRAFLTKWYAQPLFESLQKKPYLLHTLIVEREAEFNPLFQTILRETSPGKSKSAWPVVRTLAETLWVMGQDDPKYMGIGQSVIAENPKIELKCVENAGHAVHLENPAALIKIIEERLRKFL